MANEPKWDTEATVQAAFEMLVLLEKHEAAMTEVLAPGAKEGLKADASALRDGTISILSVRTEAKGATQDQNTLLADGALQVSSWRDAIKRTYPDKPKIKSDFGVGSRVHANSVKSVAESMKLLLDAEAKYPDIAREAAILPSYAGKMAATLTALVGADQAQVGKKSTSKSATKQRKATQVRVERAMERIVAAATMRFMGQPEAKEFADLLPTRARKVAKKREAPKPA